MLLLCRQCRQFPDSLHALLRVEFEKKLLLLMSTIMFTILKRGLLSLLFISRDHSIEEFSAALILFNVHYTNKAYETGIFVTYKSNLVKL